MDSRFFLLAPAAIVAALPASAITVTTVDDARLRLFPGESARAASFSLTDEQLVALHETPGVSILHRRVPAWRMSNGGWLFVERGYPHGTTLTFAVAIAPDGTVKGIEILEYPTRYSPAMLAPSWLDQFRGKKHGRSRWDLGIATISGSPLSSEAVGSGVRRALAIHALIAGTAR